MGGGRAAVATIADVAARVAIVCLACLAAVGCSSSASPPPPPIVLDAAIPFFLDASVDADATVPDAGDASDATVDARPEAEADAPLVCPEGTAACHGKCVDLTYDPAHCGACDTACPAEEVCSRGACDVACASDLLRCGSSCFDARIDPSHCGACDVQCGAGEVCSAGTCTFTCPAGTTACGQSCVDTHVDFLHCGACDKHCAVGLVCAAGACVLSCKAGFSHCTPPDGGPESAICVDTLSSDDHCGTCFSPCADGYKCTEGACVLSCQASLSACGGADGGAPTCVDLQRDPLNCGTCGTVCAQSQACIDGTCASSCPSHQIGCPVAADAGAGDAGAGTLQCVDPSIDRRNCGTCGNVCPNGQVCAAGTCELSCSGGLTACTAAGDTICVDEQTDSSHCGSCTTACGAGRICVAGACTNRCPAGETSCPADGGTTCAPLGSDNVNCGACGHACTALERCQGGLCTPLVCPAPTVSCGVGTCVDVDYDPANCGACNHACPVPAHAVPACLSGTCASTCRAGYVDCDGNATNGCEVHLADDPANCGGCGAVCPAYANGSPVCIASTCAIGACGLGWRDCDGVSSNGCEVGILTDPLNCGGCSITCSAGQVCVAGSCVTSTSGVSYMVQTNGEVMAMVVAGSDLYVGGLFTQIGGVARKNLAAVDLVTGLVTSWNPSVGDGGTGTPPYVDAIAVDGTTVYVGGAFAAVGSSTRPRLAAIDATSGLALAWNPAPNGAVQTIAVDAGKIFVGGAFTAVGGGARNHLAAFDETTGTLGAWDPNADSYVAAIVASGGLAFTGGAFGHLGITARGELAAVDETTGTPNAWTFDLGGSTPTVNAMSNNGGVLYVGGTFSTLAFKSRAGLGAIDMTTGQVTSWSVPVAGASPVVKALLATSSTIYAGGTFTIVNGLSRYNLVALKPGTGEVTPFNPVPNGRVNTLAVYGNVLFIGGQFSTAGGLSRTYGAALDATTGGPLP